MSAKKNLIRHTPFVVALFFLVMGFVGVYFQEPSRVMHQAWQVCLSCIGIG